MDKIKYFEKVKEYRLLAKHEVGQNFLCSEEIASKIVSLGEIKDTDEVLEIGSGAGSLSVFFTDYKANATLLDIDEGLIAKLKEDFVDCKNIHPTLANALKADYSMYDVIIGNLPYYITSSLIEKIALEAKSCRKAVLMIQKEVFQRLSAKMGSDDYGPLPILLDYVGSIKKEFIVSRDSFVPAPHIDSVVFSISFKNDVDFALAKKLYAFISKMFAHRRKTIHNNLQFLVNDGKKAKSILDNAKISCSARPEKLSLNDYLSLLNAYEGENLKTPTL